MSSIVAVILTLGALVISILFFVLSRRAASGPNKRSSALLLTLGITVLVLAIVFFFLFGESNQ